MTIRYLVLVYGRPYAGAANEALLATHVADARTQEQAIADAADSIGVLQREGYYRLRIYPLDEALAADLRFERTSTYEIEPDRGTEASYVVVGGQP